ALHLDLDGLAQQPARLAGFALLVGHGHEVFSWLEARVEGGEIVRRRLHPLRVVSEPSEGGVAERAEQAAYPAGLVAMIDAQQAPHGFFLADCASASLQRQPELVLAR